MKTNNKLSQALVDGSLVILAGLLFTQGYPNLIHQGFFLAPIWGLILLFKVLSQYSLKKHQVLLLALFQSTVGCVGFYWLSFTLKEFAMLPQSISLLGVFLFSFLAFPQQWIFYFLYRFAQKYKQSLPTLFHPIFLTILATSIEVISPQQFPVYLGHSWFHFKSWLSLAPILGVSFYSFLSYWFIFEYSFSSQRKTILAPLFAILLSFSIGIFSPLSIKSDHNLKTLIVQANIGNFLKLESEHGILKAFNEIKRRYRELTIPNAKNHDLIVWPETAYPLDILISNNQAQSPSFIKNIINQTQSNFFFGGYGVELSKQGSKEYNSTLLFNRQANFSQFYHKRILIPFGETLPFASLLPKSFTQNSEDIAFFDKGVQDSVFVLDQKYKFISPICYEILQSSFISDYLDTDNNIHFIINLTNDSWYGDSIEPYQHLMLAHWRSLEFQIPIIRSTNTGISSILYQDGSESERLSIGEEKVLSIDLKLNSQAKPTLYQRYGLWCLSVLMGFICLIYFIFFLFYNRKK